MMTLNDNEKNFQKKRILKTSLYNLNTGDCAGTGKPGISSH